MDHCAALPLRVLQDRMKACLTLIFVADALSMPVHWYYNHKDIVKQFGYITDYQAAPAVHPSSIMSLHSTSGGGRGSQGGSVVGDVILKNKKHLWGQRNVHYHHGMSAGSNTLNSLCARVCMRSIIENDGVYSEDKFLEKYIEFMTGENKHDDTYAESYHRDFFANYAKGIQPRKCAGTSHDTPSVGAFVTLPVIILSHYNQGREVVQQKVLSHLYLTHPDAKLARYAAVYADIIVDLLDGQDVSEAIVRRGKTLGIDVVAQTKKHPKDSDDYGVVSQNGLACYITSSFPNVLYFANKYQSNIEKAIAQNTNVGGENCHRGSALGALLGAGYGMDAIPRRWCTGLREWDTIEQEIDAFVQQISKRSPSL